MLIFIYHVRVLVTLVFRIITLSIQSTSLDECLVVSEPLGVVFIVGTWCSPVQMCLVPLIGAIAAGADTLNLQ